MNDLVTRCRVTFGHGVVGAWTALIRENPTDSAALEKVDRMIVACYTGIGGLADEAERLAVSFRAEVLATVPAAEETR